MKKKIDRTLIATTLVCLLPMLLGILLYNKLPDSIPIHFNAAGEVDRYTSKIVGVLGMPLLLTLLNVFLHFVLNNDPKKANMSRTMLIISKWCIPVISIIAQGTSLAIALGASIPIPTIMSIFVGLLFIACGNYFPKTKQNYTMGIKLPWTLNSEENWNRTHRLAGYLWVGGGFAILICGLIRGLETPLFLSIILVMTLIPTVYSYLLYKKGI
ncbi:MAG: SdpI family protein [Angelakisella sp.]